MDHKATPNATSSSHDAPPDTTRPSVTIYTTNWCGDCHRMKRRLNAWRIDYEEVDIEAHPEAAEIVMSYNDGKRRVPTLLVDGTFFPELPGKDVLNRLQDSAA